MGFSGFHGGENSRLKKSHGCKKKKSAAEGGRKFLAFFFLCKIKISVGEIFFLTSQEVKFLTFQNLTGVRFGPFSSLAGVREKIGIPRA